jgi:hypothetical protein
VRGDSDEENLRGIAAVLERFGPQATGGRGAGAAAREWLEEGFDDAEEVADWLGARCFDAAGARRLEDAGITPEQAAMKTPGGAGDPEDTLGSRLVRGELSFEEARRIITNEFWNS